MPAPSIHAFSEKVALVSGSESPVGRAVALQLALQGAYVIAGFSHSNEENRRALLELQNLGTLASAVETDVSTAVGAQKLVAEVEKMFGRLDLLVNCPDFLIDSAFEEVSEQFYEAALARSAKAAFFVSQAAVRLMKARPKPKIVNVVPALDTDAARADPLLAAAQHSVVGLTTALAAGLPEKFRVNAVAVSRRERAAASLDAELFRPQTGVRADDVARTILFLLSAEAVGLNGQLLKVE